MTKPFSALALVAVLSATIVAHAEEMPPVPSGTRVRLTSTGESGLMGTVQGTLIRLAPGTLGVVDERRGAVVAVPEASVIRVQTSPGPRRHARTGFLLGAAFGAAAVYVATSSAQADCGLYVYEPCTSGDRAAFSALGGALYGGIGALIGHFVRTEHWSDAPVAHVKLKVRLERGGGRAAVAFSF
jgi:hypothetical protein